MPSDRDILPEHERAAAKAAFQELVDKLGSQTAVAEALHISQPSVNKAILYARIGPSTMRHLLEHLGLETKGLLAKYGDPAKAPPAPPPKPPLEEAIEIAVRYSAGVKDRDVRAIAEEFEPFLRGKPVGYIIETLLREVRAKFTAPGLAEKAAARTRASQQRRVRQWQDAKRGDSAPAGAGETPPRSKSGR